MTESMQVREWQQEALARGEAIGEAKGRAEGEAKGRAEGEAKGRAAAVIKVLEARFSSVPQDLADAIRSTTDLDALDRWLPLAALADSLDTFRQAAGL
jgi:predicted transposase YdaD